MDFNKETYTIVSNVTLFLKYNTNEALKLTDVPSVISSRWNYIKDNWEFLKSNIEKKVTTYYDPDSLRNQIDELSTMIDQQRSSQSNPFADQNLFFQFFMVFDVMEIDDIEPTQIENTYIENALKTVALFTKNDFLKFREQLIKEHDIIVDKIGLNDDEYNATYYRSSVPKQVDATILDLTKLNMLLGTVQTLDYILANVSYLDTNFIDPFALARANAANPDIDIKLNKSGSMVQLNYGESLEDLAFRYFNDKNRWIDIAIANGLKPPYIDEIGSIIYLIANGDKNSININKLDNDGYSNIDKLFINQIIFIQSDTYRFSEQRKITNIKVVPVSGEIVLDLDGESDLDKYTLTDTASIRVFKSNTINSNFFILIPSEQNLSGDRKEETPWFLEGSKEDEKRTKVDLTLTDDGDLALTTSDLHLSYGLANALQAVKLKFVNELGSDPQHLELGIVNVVGMTDYDAIKKTLTDSITTQISMDSRFERVESLSITQETTSVNGPKFVVIKMVVRMAGTQRLVPISFNVSY
jgi:hypothetical protein